MIQKNLLLAVSRLHGLQCSYRNVNSEIVWSPEKTLIKMLEELSGKKIHNNEDLKILYSKKMETEFDAKVDKCQVFWGGKIQKIKIKSKHLPEKNVTAEINLEDGRTENIHLLLKEYRHVKSGYKAVYELNIELPLGYHELVLDVDNTTHSSFLICPPTKLSEVNNKTWGPFVPLYALKGENDWGIGSFKEALEMAKVLTPFGAKWMGLLPMLAGNFDYKDCDPSPYSAVSRLFWNEIYLDVESLIEKYNHQQAREIVASEKFKSKILELREAHYVNYFEVYQTKKEILLLLSDAFFANKINETTEYNLFVKENPELNAYAEFRTDNPREQNFHRFVQFEMNNTLKTFSEKSSMGLYMDYPVGVNDSGFDYKHFRNVFFGEVSVGAPPEPVFALGQDWGFPAFHPNGMRDDKYSYFRKSLQHHLKFCKILRLDHIMGLFRIYSVPKKFKGDEGVYLRFPPEELFAVVIMEAHRAGADLIGENLGTVPAAVDKIISERNLNGMWVLQCETWKDQDLAFNSIKKNQLACINTHDMPMLKSFKKGTDLDLVHGLNILSEEYKNKFKNNREAEIKKWEITLGKEDFELKALENVAKSDANYFVVNLEDLWGEEMPQNIPGTWKEYPNWRKKFAIKNSEIKENPTTNAALTVLKEFRG